jgi:hypothetical protein
VVTVGVVLAAAFERRRRLFAALERIFAARFEPRAAAELRGLAAVVAFGEKRELDERLQSSGLPTFVAPSSRPSVSVGKQRTSPRTAGPRWAVHAALLATRFEALCEAPRWWWDWPDADQSSAGVEVADVSPAGLPVIWRSPLASGDILDDALISVYLDQPIVWYGRHDDLADGYEVLAELAGWLRGLGRTEWLPLARVSRTNARISVDEADANIRVRIFSRV